jgi:hypothetical protein
MPKTKIQQTCSDAGVRYTKQGAKRLACSGDEPDGQGGAKLPLDESVLLLTFSLKAAQEMEAGIGRDNGFSLARCSARKPGFRLAGNS